MLNKVLRGHEYIYLLDPHPYNPNVLLSADSGGRLLIWDIIKGEVIKSFFEAQEEEELLCDAKWDPSGLTIAATDSDGHLSIYGIGILRP